MNTPASNDDILGILQDLMKMTAEGFARLESRIDTVENDTAILKGGQVKLESGQAMLESGQASLQHELRELKSVAYQQSTDIREIKESVKRLEDEQMAQRSDIGEILDRITVLERKATLDEVERHEAQRLLQSALDWIKLAAKDLNIPLRLT